MTSKASTLLKKSALAAALAAQSMALAGCNPEARGFALPEGDVEAGRETFVRLECNACHSVKGDVDKLADVDSDINFRLGGEVTRVKTYGDLVTSIINPSHRIARKLNPAMADELGNSRMRLYNDEMTVSELIDLTAYLQSEYEVIVPTHAYYYHGP